MGLGFSGDEGEGGGLAMDTALKVIAIAIVAARRARVTIEPLGLVPLMDGRRENHESRKQ